MHLELFRREVGLSLDLRLGNGRAETIPTIPSHRWHRCIKMAIGSREQETGGQLQKQTRHGNNCSMDHAPARWNFLQGCKH